MNVEDITAVCVRPVDAVGDWNWAEAATQAWLHAARTAGLHSFFTRHEVDGEYTAAALLAEGQWWEIELRQGEVRAVPAVNVKIENHTPHPVTLQLADSSTWVTLSAVEPCPRVCLSSDAIHPAPSVAGMRARVEKWDDRTAYVVDLPPVRAFVMYLVSREVARAARERRDLYAPAHAIRNNAGYVVAAAGLMQFATLAYWEQGQ